jgi:predicted DCC family thiol-disulfide oxidoreductase YuxK
MTKEVLYNGQCPICSAEIEQYRAQAQAAGADMRFTDLNTADLDGWGLTADTAARRLHVRDGAGAQVAGLAAFVALWQDLPRLRWLARLVRLPVLRHVAEWAYEWLAAPLLFQMHKRRQRRGTK